MLVMEDRMFDLCELLLENFKMSKEQNHPLWFGSLLVFLAMYYLGSLPAKENVIWEYGVPVARQIFRYLNSLDSRSREEVYNSYFKSFLDIWSVSSVSPATNSS